MNNLILSYALKLHNPFYWERKYHFEVLNECNEFVEINYTSTLNENVIMSTNTKKIMEKLEKLNIHELITTVDSNLVLYVCNKILTIEEYNQLNKIVNDNCWFFSMWEDVESKSPHLMGNWTGEKQQDPKDSRKTIIVSNSKGIEMVTTRRCAIAMEPIYDTLMDTPKFGFHVTPLKNLENIKKNGLLPKNYGKLQDHPVRLYLATTKTDAENLSKNKNFIKDDEESQVLLKVDLDGLDNCIAYEDIKHPQAFYINRIVPPERITVLEIDGTPMGNKRKETTMDYNKNKFLKSRETKLPEQKYD